MCCLWQAAADFKASADSSKDRDDDEETDLSQAQEMEQDASDDDDNLDGKPTNNYSCLDPRPARQASEGEGKGKVESANKNWPLRDFQGPLWPSREILWLKHIEFCCVKNYL